MGRAASHPATGLWTQCLRALVQRRGLVPILTYHRIHPEPSSISVSPAAFELQMRTLRELFHPISLTELVWRLERRSPLPAGAVVVTFDDGFVDNYQTALPILKAYDIPATFYVATGMIEERAYYWFDRVRLGLRSEAEVVQAWPALAPLIAGKPRDAQIALVTEALKREASRTAKELLDAVCEPLEPPERLTMTWDEVRALADAGMEIGSHTVTHPILSRQRLEEAEWELRHSKAVLEARTGSPVLHFAYPNGQPRDYSPVIARMVQEAGYRSATSMIPGLAGARSSLFELERLSIRYQYGLPHFLTKLSGRLARPSRSA